MSQNLQNFVKFQKFQLENLVDFEKCCKTHIFLQKSEPIQPKTSNILPKFCHPTLSDVSAGGAVTPRRDRGRHVAEEPRRGLRDLREPRGGDRRGADGPPRAFRSFSLPPDDRGRVLLRLPQHHLGGGQSGGAGFGSGFGSGFCPAPAPATLPPAQFFY